MAVNHRVAAMLAAYEKRSIDGDELYARLLRAASVGPTHAPLGDLLRAVDEAMDLGHDERQEVAWAAAAYWRALAHEV
jgi:hypothetical protein